MGLRPTQGDENRWCCHARVSGSRSVHIELDSRPSASSGQAFRGNDGHGVIFERAGTRIDGCVWVLAGTLGIAIFVGSLGRTLTPLAIFRSYFSCSVRKMAGARTRSGRQEQRDDIVTTDLLAPALGLAKMKQGGYP